MRKEVVLNIFFIGLFMFLTCFMLTAKAADENSLEMKRLLEEIDEKTYCELYLEQVKKTERQPASSAKKIRKVKK